MTFVFIQYLLLYSKRFYSGSDSEEKRIKLLWQKPEGQGFSEFANKMNYLLFRKLCARGITESILSSKRIVDIYITLLK